MLKKLRFNPQRYTDNVGAQFCLKLVELGGEDTLGEFLLKFSTAEDAFRLELNEIETKALLAAGKRSNIVTQLSDAGYRETTKGTLFSRRTMMRALTGAVGGTLLSRSIRSLPTNEESQNAMAELNDLGREYRRLREERTEILELFAKPTAELTDEEKDVLVDHLKKLTRQLGDVVLANETIEEDAGAIALAARSVLSHPISLPTIGAGIGAATSLRREVSNQVSEKTEQAIRNIDYFCEYRLGRQETPAPAVAGQSAATLDNGQEKS